jgi:hypothetical protein
MAVSTAAAGGWIEQRMGTREDVVDAALLLVSEEDDYISPDRPSFCPGEAECIKRNRNRQATA